MPIDDGPSHEHRGRKRTRIHGDVQTEPAVRRVTVEPETSDRRDALSWSGWMPIIQYNGPDFGFDALQYDFQQGESQTLDDLGVSTTSLFDDMGWSDYNIDFGNI
jgi:hypothetical protein